MWGEIQASAIFEPALHEQVREATETWVVAGRGARSRPRRRWRTPRARRRAAHGAGRRPLVALALRASLRSGGERARSRAARRAAMRRGPGRRKLATAGSAPARPPRAPRPPKRSPHDPRRSTPRPALSHRAARSRPSTSSPAGDSEINDTRASDGSVERVTNPSRSRSFSRGVTAGIPTFWHSAICETRRGPASSRCSSSRIDVGRQRAAGASRDLTDRRAVAEPAHRARSPRVRGRRVRTRSQPTRAS